MVKVPARGRRIPRMPSVTDEAAVKLRTDPAPGGYRELAALAIPLMISAGTQSLMHIVDRVLLAWYSPAAMAAALPAGILFWTVLSLPFGVAQYVNTFVAQYAGAGRKERVSASVWQGAYFAVLAGSILSAAAPLGPLLFQWINHEPLIAAYEGEYFFWLCFGAIPALLTAALSCFFSGQGRTTVVSLVNISGVIANIVLDWLLIFGPGPFPRWGVAGAAIATNLANCICVLIYILLLLSPGIQREFRFLAAWRPDLPLFRRMMRYGLPSGYNLFIDIAGFAAFIMIIGKLGPTELAATNIAFNLNTLAFIPVLGMSIAVSTLVGQRIGERRPDIAAKTAVRGFIIAGCFMLSFGLIYLLLPEFLIRPYESDAELSKSGATFDQIRTTTVVLLRFVALYSFFDAMAIIFGSAVRAAGDTLFSMIFTLCGSLLLLVLPTYWLWSQSELTLIRAWIFCSAYVIVLGLGFYARFLQGRWKTMHVIEHVPNDLTNNDDSIVPKESPELAGMA